MATSIPTQKVEFNKLGKVDLIVDAIYAGGNSGTFADDPISRILSTGNQGGFRVLGNEKNGYKLIALHSLLNDLNWPDSIDHQNGLVTYYGDNKIPGKDLHDTKKGGNKLFQLLFHYLHFGQIDKIPPIFLFVKGGEGRDLIFKGILVPGAQGIPETEDLVAIWKAHEDRRFQNYRALFSILDIPTVSRLWIDDIISGDINSKNAPKAWLTWNKKNLYRTLRAEPVTKIRSKQEQLPSTSSGNAILHTIHAFYKENSYGFEKCAAEIALLMDRNIADYDLTRRTVDGGRDAVGHYKIGLKQNSIDVDFALEAKCYDKSNSVGVKEIARLISRLRHRQFGILVTTSFVGQQAYKELQDDQHPVILITGRDIIEILQKNGYDTPDKVSAWLENFAEY